MRVLIVNQHIDHIAGGSETQCHEIASGLAARGHHVTYAVCRPGAEQPEHAYAVYPLRGDFRVAFRKALRDVRPQVVYWRFNKRGLLGSVLDARRAGAKFVFAVSHLNDVKMFAVKPFYGDQLGPARRAARAAGRLRDAAVGAFNHLALRWVDGIVFQHAGQIPHAFRPRHVVIHNSAPQRHDGATGRTQGHGEEQDPSPPFVLWVANLKQSKNPEEFIRLAADLQHTGVEFRMAGSLQDPAYRQLLESAALPGNFRYLGHQPRSALDSMMDRCLLLAHTCNPEGFPNVFIQAWAHDKTVVSLNFDPGSLLTTHRIGYCASGDYAAFKAEVERLIFDADAREQAGRRARAFVAEHCDRDKNVARLEAFLAQLLPASA